MSKKKCPAFLCKLNLIKCEDSVFNVRREAYCFVALMHLNWQHLVIMDLSNQWWCARCAYAPWGIEFYKASLCWAHILGQGVQYPASTAGRQPQTTAQWQSSIPSLHSPQTGGNSANVTDMVKWYTEHDPMWNSGRPKMAITFATSPLESRTGQPC